MRTWCHYLISCTDWCDETQFSALFFFLIRKKCNGIPSHTFAGKKINLYQFRHLQISAYNKMLCVCVCVAKDAMSQCRTFTSRLGTCQLCWRGANPARFSFIYHRMSFNNNRCHSIHTHTLNIVSHLLMVAAAAAAPPELWNIILQHIRFKIDA